MIEMIISGTKAIMDKAGSIVLFFSLLFNKMTHETPLYLQYRAVTASIFRDKKKKKISKTRGLGNLASIATATNSVIYGHVRKPAFSFLKSRTTL